MIYAVFRKNKFRGKICYIASTTIKFGRSATIQLQQRLIKKQMNVAYECVCVFGRMLEEVMCVRDVYVTSCSD